MTRELIIDRLCDKIAKGVLELEFVSSMFTNESSIYNIVFKGDIVGRIEWGITNKLLTLSGNTYDITAPEFALIASLYEDKSKESNISKTLSFLDSLGG